MPNAGDLADITVEVAGGGAQRLGYEPRLALLAYLHLWTSTQGERSPRMCIEAVKPARFSGASISSMTAKWPRMLRSIQNCRPRNIRSCRLTGPANVLVMPAFHSASISTKLLQELGGSTVIGPILVGLDRPVQIVQLGAKDTNAGQYGGAGGVSTSAANKDLSCPAKAGNSNHEFQAAARCGGLNRACWRTHEHQPDLAWRDRRGRDHHRSPKTERQTQRPLAQARAFPASTTDATGSTCSAPPARPRRFRVDERMRLMRRLSSDNGPPDASA